MYLVRSCFKLETTKQGLVSPYISFNDCCIVYNMTWQIGSFCLCLCFLVYRLSVSRLCRTVVACSERLHGVEWDIGHGVVQFQALFEDFWLQGGVSAADKVGQKWQEYRQGRDTVETPQRHRTRTAHAVSGGC